MRAKFSAFAKAVNAFSATPHATAIAFALIVAWALTGPFFRYSDTWQLYLNTATSIITFLMVFVLSNAQSRDTAAVNAKLDELILKKREADDSLIGLEKKPGFEG